MQYRRVLARDFLAQLGAFVLLAVTIVLCYRHSAALLLLVILESALVLALWHERYDICCFGVIAIFGSIAEAVFVHYGVWTYAHSSLLGVPIWFPVAFGTSGLIGARLARTATAVWDTRSPRPDASE